MLLFQSQTLLNSSRIGEYYERKEKFGDKINKIPICINGPFDEYREQKINYLGNLLFATTSLYHILSSIIA